MSTPHATPTETVLAEWAWDSGAGYRHVDTGRAYHLRYAGIGTVELSRDLRACDVRPEGERADLLPLILNGNALALTLMLRGECVLHASAVARDGGAWAFAGPPGAGKSTLAARACADGARLVTDDLLRIAWIHGMPHCLPGTPEIRLRPGASGLTGRLMGETSVAPDGRTVVRLQHAAREPVLLEAVVIPLLTRGLATPALRPLPTAEALFALLSCPRVAGLRAPSLLRRHFEWCARLAREVTVIEAHIPWR